MTVSGWVAVALRVDDAGVPCTVFVVAADRETRGDDDTEMSCVVVVEEPEPFGPFVDTLVDQDTELGTEGEAALVRGEADR